MIGLILLAAGRGTRVGNATAKQFLELHGRPVYQHALLRYAGDKLADRIALLVPPDAVDEVRGAVDAMQLPVPISVRAGGETRDLSIRAGILALDEMAQPGACRQVILHNAASPNTDSTTIQACLAALDDNEVAQACIPETRTQFLAEHGQATRMLPRTQIVTSCDPTVFRAAEFRRLLDFKRDHRRDNDTTTDAALQLGYRVALITSQAGNIKLTGPWDLAALSAAMRESASGAENASPPALKTSAAIR